MREGLLYPVIKPFNSGYLQVSNLHSLYFEELGNPDGQPVIFLHGGPGSGSEDTYRPYFDPEHYHIIVFDQRGAGRSLPYAEIKENTTDHLIDDIEKIRKHLGIDTWIIFGDCWGSALALCYTIRNKTCVKALVLRGLFLCRKSEVNWLYKEGASHIFADKWEEFIEIIPEEERDDLVKAYHKRLTSENYDISLKAAKAWGTWEGNLLRLIPDEDLIDNFSDPELAESLAQIECHYFMNDMFMESDTYILDHVDEIRNIPCVMVQGRYDVVTPMRSAWEIHKKWPESDLRIVQDCGHSAFEQGIADELVKVMQAMKIL